MSDHLFKKGEVGNPAGRPKGSKNKFKIDASEVFKKHNYNPLIELIKLGQKENLTDRLRMETNAELCQYLYPKLKSVEITADEALERFQLVFNVGDNASNNVQRDEDSEPLPPE
jgi:hypothetical protein